MSTSTRQLRSDSANAANAAIVPAGGGAAGATRRSARISRISDLERERAVAELLRLAAEEENVAPNTPKKESSKKGGKSKKQAAARAAVAPRKKTYKREGYALELGSGLDRSEAATLRFYRPGTTNPIAIEIKELIRLELLFGQKMAKCCRHPKIPFVNAVTGIVKGEVTPGVAFTRISEVAELCGKKDSESKQPNGRTYTTKAAALFLRELRYPESEWTEGPNNPPVGARFDEANTYTFFHKNLVLDSPELVAKIRGRNGKPGKYVKVPKGRRPILPCLALEGKKCQRKCCKGKKNPRPTLPCLALEGKYCQRKCCRPR